MKVSEEEKPTSEANLINRSYLTRRLILKINIKKFFAIKLLLFLMIFTISCEAKKTVNLPNFIAYDGEPLVIGVIGTPPNVKEEQVTFKNINFSDLDNLQNYDAIFIMKEHLSEAAEPQFASIYANSKIPFFWIQSTKSVLPFLHAETTYENAPKTNENDYVSGLIIKNGNSAYWGSGLYNDLKNNETIKDCYSRIFTLISENK